MKDIIGSKDIICPYCHHIQDNEVKYHNVSYWGEDSKKIICCENCSKEFWIEENVIRLKKKQRQLYEKDIFE